MELEPAPPVLQNGFSPRIVEENSCDVQMLNKIDPDVEAKESPVTSRRAVLLYPSLRRVMALYSHCAPTSAPFIFRLTYFR